MEQIGQGSGENIIPGSVQKMCGCGPWEYGFVELTQWCWVNSWAQWPWRLFQP